MHESPDQNTSEALQEIVPAGRKVVLRKVNVQAGVESGIALGDELRGVLRAPIVKGAPVDLENGNTSDVKSLFSREGRTYIETQTSTYEVIVEQERFTGLQIKSELGNVALPFDAREAQLGGGDVSRQFQRPEGGEQITLRINKDALQGVLLEAHNGEIFRAVGGRFFVLARVGDIHLPFYISSSGQSGKREGEWYPFFGYTGDWLIKGHIDRDKNGNKNGDMTYSPEITRVQQLLNENLILPKDDLDESGKIMRQNPTTKAWEIEFDIGRHLKYQRASTTEFAGRKDDDAAFMHRITGYAPSHKINQHGRGEFGEAWIQSIVSQIKPTR